MIQERAIVEHLLAPDLPKDISGYLVANGFLNAQGEPFTKAQINSLMHSARQELRKQSYKRVESCGIDREKNPCGDASDY